MTIEQALQYLRGLVNYEQQSPSARDLILEPIRLLLNALGNPHDRLLTVHVAGSKGKGSFAAMMEKVLRTAGYRTGLYTSPQLSSLEERIQINGTAIAPTKFADWLGKVQTAALESKTCTFFDVMTALAFLCFAVEQVDIAIVEVGMGGRTDSTNICTPKVTVITSISYDHTKQLGNTLSAIATEKAGIIKPGCPTISGVLPEEAKKVIETTCRERESPLWQLHKDFTYSYTPGEFSHSVLEPSWIGVTTRARRWPRNHLGLLGEHQAANAALVIAAIEQLQTLGFAIGDDAVAQGLSQVQWPARIEIVRHSPLVILDCAHNPASAQALVDTLLSSFPEHMGPRKKSRSRRSLIFSASRDKDLTSIMNILAPHFDHVYLTQYTSSARCASADDLRAALRNSQSAPSSSFIADPVDAWNRVESSVRTEDLICVTGSVFLAGELRPSLLER
jgi:dihydrofolate synthase / folylpolyglutamate synthase